jgi:hypothetical protein
MQIGNQPYPFTDQEDSVTHSAVVIDYVHHEIHEGDHFFCNIADTDVDIIAPKYFHIVTPNTAKWAHLTLMLTSTGAGKFEFFENPTINVAGTAVTVFNSDRNSIKANTTLIKQDSTTTSDGTLIWTSRVGAGERIVSGSTRSDELILKQNEDYILKFTPDADNASIVVDFRWYEHANS